MVPWLTHSCPTANQEIVSYVLTIHMYLVSTYLLVPTKCFRYLPTYIVTIYFVYSLAYDITHFKVHSHLVFKDSRTKSPNTKLVI
jgi:hypothetical protein